MKEIKFGTNQFCGPSVLSAIAGISTDEAAAIIAGITGQKKAVKAVYLSDLKTAFRSLGFEVETLSPMGHSVFSALYSLHGNDGQYIFMVSGHFIAIECLGNHKFICDNHTKSPINVSNSSRLGMKVVALFRVSRKG